MNSLRKKETHTIEDIYNLPEGERAELIDGQIYYLAAPNRMHQKLSVFLARTIGNYIASNNGKCEIYTAPFAVFLNNDDINYVEPDISVICDMDKLDDKGCHGSPDWIIEIVSAGSKRMDYLIKLFKYRNAGVKEYWIVDAEKNRITVYNFEYDTVEEFSFGEDVPVGIYQGFSIKIE